MNSSSTRTTAPTCFDVINGRGKNVHYHPGNQKYRSLVYLNKSLYAICPRSDKAKISKSIVAAIREFGGGFLELDERSGVYYEIGDKKAWAKTSQALREGQTKIRQKIYREEKGQLMKNGENQAIPREGYLRYSIQVLESLYKSEETSTLSHKPLQPEAANDNLVPSLPSLSDTQVASQEETNLELLANMCAV